MNSLSLIPSELLEITGYSLPRFQRRWLDKNHWRYVQNRAGYPVVAREYALQQLGVIAASRADDVGHQPNFDAIKSRR
jgi:hypothetical protein